MLDFVSAANHQGSFHVFIPGSKSHCSGGIPGPHSFLIKWWLSSQASWDNSLCCFMGGCGRQPTGSLTTAGGGLSLGRVCFPEGRGGNLPRLLLLGDLASPCLHYDSVSELPAGERTQGSPLHTPPCVCHTACTEQPVSPWTLAFSVR